MKRIRQFLTITLAGLALTLPGLHAQVVSGFEATNGNYVDGNSIIGVNDTSIGAAWSLVIAGSSAPISSGATPKEGSLAVRLTDASASSGSNASINLANASSIMTAEFEFKLSMNIRSISSDGTGAQVQFYLGAPNSGNSNHWLRFEYNDSTIDGTENGNLRLYTGNGVNASDSAITGVSFASLGGFGTWLDIVVRIDPLTMKYTSVNIGGIDLTSEVLASNGGTVPWDASVGTTPGTALSVYTGGNDVVVVDFDAFSLNAVPEPAILSLLVPAVSFIWLARRRRNTGFSC